MQGIRVRRTIAPNGQSRLIGVFCNILRGAAIGVAFIIPGFSGGTVAAILGIYEELIGAVADLWKHFVSSVKILLPIAVGMILGVGALILPIQWGLANYPLPTVSLFAGLALGGISPLKRRAGKPTFGRCCTFLCAFAIAAGLSFLPQSTHAAGFLYRLDFVGYLILAGVGVLASCALVVPGISGSMLLLVLGYYSPLVSVITGIFHGTNVAIGIAVIAVFCAGLAGGFFLISALMKTLLIRAPFATYSAVLGLIFGSVIAVYAPMLRANVGTGWTWLAAVLLLVCGIALSASFVRIANRRKNAENPPRE